MDEGGKLEKFCVRVHSSKRQDWVATAPGCCTAVRGVHP